MCTRALRVFILFAPIAVAMTGPSSAGDPITDCNSDNIKLRLQGCTAVIDSGKYAGVDLAIAYSLRSDGRMASRDFDGTIQDLAKAAELEPAKQDDYKKRLADVYRQRGDARKKAKDLDGAIGDYSQVIKIDPSRHEALLGRSDAYAMKKDYDKAIADLAAAMENQPETEERKTRLGKLYERRGIERLLKSDADGAIADYTEAIRLDGANAALYLARAEAYKQKKDWDRALEDYSQAIRAKPGLADAYLGRSELYRQKGENGHAIDDLTEALKKQPKNIDALLRRGLAHEENKQLDKALADYRAVVRIDRSHKQAKEGITRVTSAQASAVEEKLSRSLTPHREGPYTLYDNYDLEGGEDLRQMGVANRSECGDVCSADASCRAYSFDKWNRLCFLKASVGALRLEPKSVSGVSGNAGTPEHSAADLFMARYRGKTFPNGGQNVRSNSLEDCENRCLIADGCVAFTHLKKSKQCRLMRAAGEYFSKAGADSGVKRQIPFF